MCKTLTFRGGLRGFLPGQSSTQRTVEQLVESSSGGLQKKREGTCSLQVGTGRALELIHAGCSGVVSSLEEPVQEVKKEDHEEVHVPDSIEWVASPHPSATSGNLVRCPRVAWTYRSGFFWVSSVLCACLARQRIQFMCQSSVVFGTFHTSV